MDARTTTATLTSAGPLHHSERPILLLHGFLATARAVGWLADRLGRSGYYAHHVELGGLFGRFNTRPMEEPARVVAERVEQLARDHRCQRIDLVGHSAGGLIGRVLRPETGRRPSRAPPRDVGHAASRDALGLFGASFRARAAEPAPDDPRVAVPARPRRRHLPRRGTADVHLLAMRFGLSSVVVPLGGSLGSASQECRSGARRTSRVAVQCRDLFDHLSRVRIGGTAHPGQASAARWGGVDSAAGDKSSGRRTPSAPGERAVG
jgi:pimeloyl-ACP methyl ester carboxylesterase